MRDIEFKSNDELKDYIKEHLVKSLGGGKDGVCSLLDDGSVIKHLYEDYYPSYALQFKDIYNPSFVFARNGAYLNGFVRGIFMEYASGKTVSEEKPNNQNILTLGNHLEVLSQNIITLSSKGVMIKDFHPGNLIYDSSNFRIVDTLPFLLIPGANYETDNIREVMPRIYESLLEDILSNQEMRSNYSFYGRRNYWLNPSEYFRNIKSHIEDITEEQVTTLEEAGMALKRKFKR